MCIFIKVSWVVGKIKFRKKKVLDSLLKNVKWNVKWNVKLSINIQIVEKAVLYLKIKVISVKQLKLKSIDHKCRSKVTLWTKKNWLGYNLDTTTLISWSFWKKVRNLVFFYCWVFVRLFITKWLKDSNSATHFYV